MVEVLFVTEVVFLVFILVVTVLYWVSTDRWKAVLNVAALLLVYWCYFLIIHVFVLPGDAGWTPKLGLLASANIILLILSILHYFLVIEANKWKDYQYDFAGPPVAIGVGIWLLGGLLGIRALQFDQHFFSVIFVTCMLNFLGRRFFASESYFRWAAVVVVLGYLLAVVLDAFVYDYGEGDYILSLIRSAAVKGFYALAAILFFSYNLLRLGVVAEVNRRKLVLWSLTLVAGSLLYRNPLTRDFANRIPIFKDLLPASAGFGAVLVFPIGILISKWTERRTLAANTDNQDIEEGGT